MKFMFCWLTVWFGLIYYYLVLKILHLFPLQSVYHTPDILTFTGIPQYIQSQWALTDETLQFEDVNGESLQAEESIWPDMKPEIIEVVTLEDQNLLTTPESYVIKEQGGLVTI